MLAPTSARRDGVRTGCETNTYMRPMALHKHIETALLSFIFILSGATILEYYHSGDMQERDESKGTCKNETNNRNNVFLISTPVMELTVAVA